MFESLGRAEEEGIVERGRSVFEDRREIGAKCCRKALRLVKYKAEPKPVLIIDGRVPRHSCRIALGPAVIS